MLIVSDKRFVPDSLYMAAQTSTILTLENVTFVQNQTFWQMTEKLKDNSVGSIFPRTAVDRSFMEHEGQWSIAHVAIQIC